MRATSCIQDQSCVNSRSRMDGDGYSRRNVELTEEASEALFQKRRYCCFFPGNAPASGLSWWRKIGSSEIQGGDSLWSRGVSALKKIREWSEIVAGPRWKTFIRRFNRNKNRGGSSNHADFKYDALSYAMNFDEGPGLNSHFDDDGEDGYYTRNFSSRYAKGSMDTGKEGAV